MHVEHIDETLTIETATMLLNTYAGLREMDKIHPYDLPKLLQTWIQLAGEFGYRYNPRRTEAAVWRWWSRPV